MYKVTNTIFEIDELNIEVIMNFPFTSLCTLGSLHIPAYSGE